MYQYHKAADVLESVKKAGGLVHYEGGYQPSVAKTLAIVKKENKEYATVLPEPRDIPALKETKRYSGVMFVLKMVDGKPTIGHEQIGIFSQDGRGLMEAVRKFNRYQGYSALEPLTVTNVTELG